MLVRRLDFGPGVREALAFTFERWNGKGFPNHVGGEAIPLAMRVVHLSHDMEAIGRIFSPERARRRRPRPPRPHLRPGARRPVRRARAEWFERLRTTEPVGCGPGARARAAPPARRRRPSTTRSRSPPTSSTSSRRTWSGTAVAARDLAADAARVLGLADDAITGARPGGARARLRHHGGLELDLGQAGLADADGVRPRRAPPDADRADAAPLPGARRAQPGRVARTTRSATGPGYHKRMRADTGDLGACVLAATEIYVGMTTERADRPAFSPEDAAAELRRLESEGVIEPRASRAVLVAAGHGEPRAPARQAQQNPGGLSRREVEVLQPRRARAHDAADRRSALHLRPRPPTTTSSTSTPRSACRRGPPRRSGRSRTACCPPRPERWAGDRAATWLATRARRRTARPPLGEAGPTCR